MRRRGKLGQCLDYLVQHLITIIKDPSYFPLLFCHACYLLYHVCCLGFVPRWAPSIAAKWLHKHWLACPATTISSKTFGLCLVTWFLSKETFPGNHQWLPVLTPLSELCYIFKTKPIPSKQSRNAMNDFHRFKCIPELGIRTPVQRWTHKQISVPFTRKREKWLLGWQ